MMSCKLKFSQNKIIEQITDLNMFSYMK